MFGGDGDIQHCLGLGIRVELNSLSWLAQLHDQSEQHALMPILSANNQPGGIPHYHSRSEVNRSQQFNRCRKHVRAVAAIAKRVGCQMQRLLQHLGHRKMSS